MMLCSSTRRLLARSYCTSEGREIKIPVPWGHIAAKEWGNPSGKPILCLHGWQDNAGSFDPLIPLLDQRFRYIAPDAGGHGLSTPYPPGMFYNFWDLIIQIQRIAQHLKLDKFSIIGHSMGGGFGIVYASVFPMKVEKLATLDMVKPITLPLAWHTQDVGEAIDENLMAEQKMLTSEPRVVPLETLVKRYVDGSFENLSANAARILLKRGAKQSKNGDGYFFVRDLRQNVASIPRFQVAEQMDIIKNIKCELLLIKAKDAPSYEPAQVYDDFVKLYPKHCQIFKHVEIDGKHHVHMDQPERVAPHLLSFFDDY